jgi:hypothetical protein
MELIGALFILLYVFAAIFIFIAIIYLIVRRINERDRETFEKRDN